MRPTTGAALLGLMLLVATAPGFAAEDQAKAPGWQFEFLPYAWLPGMFGTLEVRGPSATSDVTIGDVLTLLWHGDAFTAGGYFGARYERWSLFADAYGGFLNAHVTEQIPTRSGTRQVGATADTKPVIAEIAAGYQLGEWPLRPWDRPASLGVYLGTRIVHMGVSLGTPGGLGLPGPNPVSNSFTTATPLIGVRGEMPIYYRTSLDFRGDLGGLPSGDRLNWGFVGDLRYWFESSPWGTHPWLEVGYRVVGFNHGFGRQDNLDLQLRGPLLGLGVGF